MLTEAAVARHNLVRSAALRSACRRSWALAAIAAACGAAGLKIVSDQLAGVGPTDARPAGWLLLAACAVQLRLVVRLARVHSPQASPLGKTFFLRLTWGIVACWIACQVGGRIPSPEKLVALAGVWYSLCLARTLALLPGSNWQRWAARLHLRQVEQAAVAVAVLLLAGEAALRSVDWAGDRSLTARHVLAGIKLKPGTQYDGQSVNHDGYCDDEFDSASSAGQFRIAALGDETILAADRQASCLKMIERRQAGLRIYNFAMPGCHPIHYAHQVRLDVGRYRPELVLAFVSLGGDLQPPQPNAVLAWQALCIARRLWRPPLAVPTSAADAELNYEAYLRLTGHRLLLCRTPLNPKAQRRWNELLAELDELAHACRQKHAELALVLVPADYQVSPRLCQAAGRRMGCEASQLDLELPQRRLTAFAAEHDAGVIDLLPHFRAATEPAFCRNQQRLSAHGHRVASRVIGDWLAAHRAVSVATTAKEGKQKYE